MILRIQSEEQWLDAFRALKQYDEECGTNTRVGSWIPTVTNTRIWLEDPRPDDICIEDIAQGLANTCRFCGQIPKFYSVAQHSVHVSFLAESLGGKKYAMAGLLHDASEAYIHDLTSPFKEIINRESDNFYSRLEEEFQRAVAKGFGFHFEHFLHKSVKDADVIAVLTEARDLVPSRIIRTVSKLDACSTKISPMLPDQALDLFMARYEAIKNYE